MRKCSEFRFFWFGAAWLLLSGVIIGIDHCTKMCAVLRPYGQVDQIIGSWLRVRLAFNEGVAFGIGHDLQGFFPIVLLMLSVFLTVLLLVWLLTIRAPQWRSAAAIALILGGAVGNLWDRLSLGYVIDFIDIGVGYWRWPTFNVADSCISLGAAWLCYQAYKKQK